MKKTIIIVLFLSILWCCQEKNEKPKGPYKQGDTYEFEGKKYLIKGANYYPNGTDEFLVLGIDTLDGKYEKHLFFDENGKKKKLAFINPQIDTTTIPTNYKGLRPVIYTFIGYILKEETFYENGKHRSISIRNSNISDSTFNHIAYKEDGSLKRKTKDRKVNNMWIIEKEKDGKITIDTSYFWK